MKLDSLDLHKNKRYLKESYILSQIMEQKTEMGKNSTKAKSTRYELRLILTLNYLCHLPLSGLMTISLSRVHF